MQQNRETLDGTGFVSRCSTPGRTIGMRTSFAATAVASSPVVGLLLLAVTSCGPSVTGPAAIQATLELSTTQVAPGDSFRVTLTLANPTSQDVSLWSPVGCLSLPNVYQAGVRLNWAGTAYLCTQATSSHVVPAGGVRVLEFDLVAALQESSFPYEYVVDPTPGSYEVRMSMYVDLPDVSRQLTVLVD